jgi:peptidoglycan hydrolase FlgJ
MNFAITTSQPTAASSATTVVAARHRKLTDAAQQFEGMLLQEMLKPMKEHGFAQDEADDGDDKDAGSGFGDTLSSFGSETLATAIAKSGGFGIAKRVVEQVESENVGRIMVAAQKPGKLSG